MGGELGREENNGETNLTFLGNRLNWNLYTTIYLILIATSSKKQGYKLVQKLLFMGIFLVSLISTTTSLPIHKHLSAKLPELPENYVDRLEDKNDIEGDLDDRYIYNLYGEHGIGKSTLAIKIGREKANGNASTVYYINLADFPNKNFQTVLARRLLQTPSSISQFHDFSDLISHAKQYHNNEETLLILDNCDSIISTQMSDFEEAIEKLADHIRS